MESELFGYQVLQSMYSTQNKSLIVTIFKMNLLGVKLFIREQSEIP